MIADPAAINAWARTTHPVRNLPAAVAITRTADEVQAVMRLGIPAFAHGQGMNIGLGGRLPASGIVSGETTWIALDLSRHQAIGPLDETLGTITLGPGVSFATLYALLAGRESRWFMPAIGGPPDTSVIANMLQRGDGAGPGGDMGAALLGIEAVLQGGQKITAHRYHAGPDLVGQFQQSGLGVVTCATVALRPLPALTVGFSFRVARRHLGSCANALAGCLRDGILQPGAVSIWSGAKLAVRDGRAGDDNWHIFGALHAASQRRAEADWAGLTDRLRSVIGIELTVREMQLPSRQGIFQGQPTAANLAFIRSGLRSAAGEPGFAWLCPVLPFTGEALIRAIDIFESVMLPAGLIPNLAFGCVDWRHLRCYAALAWDRADPAFEARALQAYQRLQDNLAAAGMPLFRLGHL